MSSRCLENPVLGDRQWVLLLGNLDLDAMTGFTHGRWAVFRKGVSPYGAHDMGGNLWEWVRDRYIKDYYHAAPSHDPPGPANASPYHVRCVAAAGAAIVVKSALLTAITTWLPTATWKSASAAFWRRN